MRRRVPLFAVLTLAVGLAPRLAVDAQPPTPTSGAERRAPVVPIGTYLATRIDRESLPVADRVVDDDGTLYLIEFDRMVITLQPDLRFRAAVRFRRTLFSSDPRGRARPTPLQSMNVTGRYDVGVDRIQFTPDPSSDTRALKMLSGTVTGVRELSIPFHYRNGTQERQRTLVMQRRDNIL